MITPRTKLRPMRGKVILEPQPPRTHSDGGIEIPEAYREVDGVEGIVRWIGGGPVEFTRGDRVIISKRAPGTKVILHPKRMKLLDANEVKAVFV